MKIETDEHGNKYHEHACWNNIGEVGKFKPRCYIYRVFVGDRRTESRIVTRAEADMVGDNRL